MTVALLAPVGCGRLGANRGPERWQRKGSKNDATSTVYGGQEGRESPMGPLGIFQKSHLRALDAFKAADKMLNCPR